MSTPFLVGFTRAVLKDLMAAGLIEVVPDHDEEIVWFVAGFLADVPLGGSLVDSLAKGLLACEHVEELYADNLQLKQVVQDLRSTPAQWVRG